MIDYETIKPVVEKIARYQANKMAKKYSKNSYAYVKELTEEFTQECYIKAYEIMNERPDASIELIAFSLFKRIGDMLRVMNKRNEMEISSDIIEQYSENDNYTVRKHYSEKTPSDLVAEATSQHHVSNETELQSLVEYVLEKTSGYPDYIKTYVIAKLKLEGYLSADMYPDVDVSMIDTHDDSKGTEHSQIIENVLQLKHARSGGPKAFKVLKRELFYDIIYELELDDLYKKGYKITYKLNDGSVKTKVLHAYSEDSVASLLLTNYDVNEIIDIELND